MIIQARANVGCQLQVNDQEAVQFDELDPMIIPARWAIPVLIDFPDKFEVVSSVDPGPGCEVLWDDGAGDIRRGIVLQRFHSAEEGTDWALVQSDKEGRFIPLASVIGVNPHPLFQLVGQAVKHLGTPAAKAMARDLVMTLLGQHPDA